MGSKKAMLKNGLGEMLLEQSQKSNRVFDPFCGSASVSCFVAENTDRQVIAGDLQKYSIDLANSILLRNKEVSENQQLRLQDWNDNVQKLFKKSAIDIPLKETKKCVTDNRLFSSNSRRNIVKAYGGYYFSYNQALAFDLLLNHIPQQEPTKSIAVAALIEAASQCSASPGHTAQPFGLTPNGLKAIFEAWNRNPFDYVTRHIKFLATKYAKTIGSARVSEANNLLSELVEGDLVFLDPPYSGVHYSRFYHVLETISRNSKVDVTGTGRYPDPLDRPKSNYSLKGGSKKALNELLLNISQKKASAILTFPSNACSNGLSGDIVKEISQQHFKVKKEIIKGAFSTMGGNNKNRPARQASAELVLLLEPK
jgi:adenine-specific DNA-methyltransferase